MPKVSRELVERAVAGDRASIRELVDALTPIIHQHVARTLFRRRRPSRDIRQEVEDRVQEVFATLFRDRWRLMREWDPDRGSIEAFLRVIAERQVFSTLRTKKQSPWTDEPTEQEAFDRRPDAAGGPEAAAMSRELLGSIHRALMDRLSDLGQALFELLFLEDRPVDEVCGLMGLSPDAVYAWRSRLTRLVREIAVDLAARGD